MSKAVKKLFDKDYYLTVYQDIKENENVDPYEHYIKYGHKEGRMPNPLFDPIFYRLTQMKESEYDQEPLQHYLNLKDKKVDTHPLFDCKFYLSKVKEPINGLSPLEHFLTKGWKKNYCPTPYFNFEYYLENNSDIKKYNLNPLVHYLQYGEAEDRLPHKGFHSLKAEKPFMYELWNLQAYNSRRRLSAFAISKEDKTNIYSPDLLDQLEDILDPNKKIRRIFDGDFYLAVYDDIKSANVSPLEHYLEFGSLEGRLPNALFDPIFYRLKNMKEEDTTEPIVHYVQNPNKHINTHPLFDAKYYYNKLGEVDEVVEKDETLLEHFLTKGYKKDLSPSPYFDCKFYLEKYPNIRQYKLNPLVHYLSYGEKEGYNPSKEFAPNFFEFPPLTAEDNYMVFTSKTKLQLYAENKIAHNKPFQRFLINLKKIGKDALTVVFVTHDASRTGAPLIILKLAEYFKKHLNVTPLNVIFKGDDLTQEFESLGPTYTLQHFMKNPNMLEIEMKALSGALKGRIPIAALVNSAESRIILPHLNNQNIQIINLVHEMADYYPPNEWVKIAENSDLVVFPSQPVKKQAIKNTKFKDEQLKVLGQGLFKPEILKVDKKSAKEKIRKELTLPDNAFIVLGCGTTNERKGIDIYVATAINYIQSSVEKKPVYFVWLGEVIDEYCINRALKDIKLANLEDKILFPGAVKDTTNYFVGSDVFYLTSRADPFPCVIHEAMAAQLPVIGFENTGGFVEAIDDTCGFAVPFKDISAVSNIIDGYIAHPEKLILAGANAKKRVIEQFDYLDYTKKIGRLLVDLKTDAQNQQVINAKKEKLLTYIDNKAKFIPKKKVIFALSDWYISGVNTVVDNLVRQLNKLGFDAFILFTNNQIIGQAEELMPEAPYQFLTDKELSIQDTWCELKSYVEASAPCVFFPNCDYVASSLSPDIDSKVGIIGVLHSDDSEHYEHGYRLGHYWNHVVTVSDLIKQKMKTYNPLFDSKTTAILNGIDLTEYEKPKKNEVFSIIYTGRIVQYQKRVFDLIKIAELLDKRGVEFVFTFIGGGEDEGEFMQKIVPLEEKGRIRYLGRQPKEVVNEELAKHHIFALFSDFEGLPMSLLEAMACWCAPIVTDIESGIQEILEHEKNSIISPLDDIEAFVDHLEKLSKSPELVNKLAKNTFETLKSKRVRSEDMGEAYAKVINKVFEEIEAGEYERIEALTFRSPFGNKLIPPMMQKLG